MTNDNSYSAWIDDLARKGVTKEALGNHRQDLSRPILEDLLARGYDTVTWDSGASKHSQCQALNNKQWSLDAFLVGLNHDAPIFERSHPGDISCSVLITGPGLPEVIVDSYGMSAGQPTPTIKQPTDLMQNIENIPEEETAEEFRLTPTELQQVKDYVEENQPTINVEDKPQSFWQKMWDYLTSPFKRGK